MTPEMLNEFIVFSKHLNVTRAANELNLSASTLSRHLSALAKEVGTPLFTHGPGQLELTPAGAQVLRSACTIVAEYRSMLADVAELAANAGRTIRIAYALDDRTSIDCISIAKARLAKAGEPSPIVSWVKPGGKDYRRELLSNKADIIVDYDLEEAPLDDRLAFVPLVQDSIVLALPKGTFPGRRAIDVGEVCDRFIPHPSISVDNYLDKVMGLFSGCRRQPQPRFINAASMDDFFMHLLDRDEMWLFSRRQLFEYPGAIPRSYRETIEIHELAGCDTTLRRFAVYRHDNPNPLVAPCVDAMAKAL